MRSGRLCKCIASVFDVDAICAGVMSICSLSECGRRVLELVAIGACLGAEVGEVLGVEVKVGLDLVRAVTVIRVIVGINLDTGSTDSSYQARSVQSRRVQFKENCDSYCYLLDVVCRLFVV